MMMFLRCLLWLCLVCWSPSLGLAANAEEMERDIPSLIERFISTSTKLGSPHSYVWVIEELTPDSAGGIAVEIRVLSASLNRTDVTDERYRILFAYLEPNPIRPYGVTVIVGSSKLSGSTKTCQLEK